MQGYEETERLSFKNGLVTPLPVKSYGTLRHASQRLIAVSLFLRPQPQSSFRLFCPLHMLRFVQYMDPFKFVHCQTLLFSGGRLLFLVTVYSP